MILGGKGFCFFVEKRTSVKTRAKSNESVELLPLPSSIDLIRSSSITKITQISVYIRFHPQIFAKPSLAAQSANVTVYGAISGATSLPSLKRMNDMFLSPPSLAGPIACGFYVSRYIHQREEGLLTVRSPNIAPPCKIIHNGLVGGNSLLHRKV